MNIIFHADDYGLSRGITDNILLCHDQGVLNRVSLIVNGYAYDYALEELKKRETLKCCVHVNLLEGYPLTESNALVNQSTGLFNLTFGSILTANDKLKQQIIEECSAQIIRLRQHLSVSSIRIDSHQHVHMIPWLFEALIKRKHTLGIDHIRCPIDNGSLNDLLFSHPLSTIKNTVLSLMNLMNKKRHYLVSHTFEDQELFWGILYTGKQNQKTITRGIKRLKDKKNQSHKVMEILLHPGYAVNGEESLWDHYPKLLTYYYSLDRVKEQQTLMHFSFPT